jgi:agmatinase
MVSLLGIPFDAGSTYARGPALAPGRIREALRSDSSNLWTEDGIDLGEPGRLHDAGDLVLPEEVVAASARIEEGVREVAALGHPLICLGGDHSITYPILRGLSGRFPDLTILHFDAHPDLYDDYGGRLSHACQFARIMEERLARRLVQVGIRTMSGHQLEQARRFGVEVIAMRNLATVSELRLEGPLFISCDTDVIDPAYAPGVSHHEPGGLSVRELLTLIQGIRVPIVGADLVEYNPARDVQGQTAMVCAKVLKEIAAAVLRGGRAPGTDWV